MSCTLLCFEKCIAFFGDVINIYNGDKEMR